MLNRTDPMVSRAVDVFREINLEALDAGESIQCIRHLFEPELPNRTRSQLPELIVELQPVLHILALRIKGTLRVDAPHRVPDPYSLKAFRFCQGAAHQRPRDHPLREPTTAHWSGRPD